MNIRKIDQGPGVSIVFGEVKQRRYVIVKNVQEAKPAIIKKTDSTEC